MVRKRIMFETRQIDGKSYHSYSNHNKKARADKEADKLRKWPSVVGVRVIKTGLKNYTVFVSQKGIK